MGQAFYGQTRTVDVHVRRLRQKLGEAAQDRIETVIGVGYRFGGDSPTRGFDCSGLVQYCFACNRLNSVLTRPGCS